MTEPLPGIELFLSTEKAAAEAARWKSAVDSAADAVLRIGGSLDTLQGSLDSVTGKGLATGLRDSSSAAGDLAKALDDIVAQKRREIDLGEQASRGRQQRLVSLEAEKKLGRELTEQEKASAIQAANEIAAYRERLRLRKGEGDAAAASRRSEEERQRRVAAVTQAYQDQLAVARSVGTQQDVIRATIKATNDAKAIGLSLDSEAAKRLREIAVESAKARSEAKLREESERRANALSARGRAAPFEVRGAAEAVANARRIEDALASAGRTAVASGRQVLAFASGLGAAVGVTSATRAFADYEDKLAILGTVSGATAKQLKELESAAIDVSRSTRFSPREALQGLTELARAGFTSEQAIAAIKPTADLARSGLIGLSDSATIVFQTLSQFGLSATQSARVADVLAKAAGTSTANVSTLADSLAKAAPIASQLGVSLEDTVALLTVLADKGIAPAIAGTGFGRILLQLQTPTEEAQRTLEGLGLSLDKIAPKTATAGGALRTLANANLTLQDATNLVGTEFAGLLTILTQGVGAAEKVGDALRRSGGEAAKQAAAGADSLAAAFSGLSSASERFAVATLNGGVGDALTTIVRTGSEVLDVLGQDEKKMAEASIAAKALAASLQTAAIAGAAFGAAKIAGSLQSTIASIRALTAATIAYDAATGTSVATASRASKAISGLWAAMRANPLVSLAAGVGAVVSAFYIFGSGAEDAAKKAEKLRDAAAKLEEQNKALAIASKAALGGEFSDRSSQEEALREARNDLVQLGKELDAIGSKTVPLDKVLQARGLSGVTIELGKLRQIAEEFPRIQRLATDQAELEFQRLQKLSGSQPPTSSGLAVAAENSAKAAKIQADILQSAAESFSKLGVQIDSAGQLVVDYDRTLQLVKDSLVAVDEQAKKAGLSLETVNGATDASRISSAVTALIAQKEKELQVNRAIGEEQIKLLILEDGKRQKGAELIGTEKELLASLAKRVFEAQKEIEARRKATQEAERAAELQKELPAKLEEIRRKYEQELLLTRATGVEREIIRAEIDAENRAKEIGLGLDKARAVEDAAALEDLKERGRELARLEFAQRNAKQEIKADNRSAEAIRDLEQEEKLVRLAGQAREDYRILLEAENAARQAGLVVGTAEYNDYLRRKVAVAELARATEEATKLFGDFGNAAFANLENIILRTEKTRDAIRALGEDLLRLAYRQTVVANGQRLFEALGTAIAGGIAGSQGGGGGGVTPPRSQPGAGYVPPDLGTQSASLSSSFAGFFPEEPQPRRKRVGFGALEVGGSNGGGDVITMTFPSVRTVADARAMKATIGQQIRQLKQVDRRGMRGLRPQGQ